jgi:hypothetical protein
MRASSSTNKIRITVAQAHQLVEDSIELPHSVNQESKPNSYYGYDNNCQDTYHEMVVPYQSDDFQSTNDEQSWQFPGHN